MELNFEHEKYARQGRKQHYRWPQRARLPITLRFRQITQQRAQRRTPDTPRKYQRGQNAHRVFKKTFEFEKEQRLWWVAVVWHDWRAAWPSLLFGDWCAWGSSSNSNQPALCDGHTGDGATLATATTWPRFVYQTKAEFVRSIFKQRGRLWKSNGPQKFIQSDLQTPITAGNFYKCRISAVVAWNDQ